MIFISNLAFFIFLHSLSPDLTLKTNSNDLESVKNSFLVEKRYLKVYFEVDLVFIRGFQIFWKKIPIFSALGPPGGVSYEWKKFRNLRGVIGVYSEHFGEKIVWLQVLPQMCWNLLKIPLLIGNEY